MRFINFAFLMAVFAIATTQPTKAAMDCVAETPLPSNISTRTPADNVPKAMARYVGTWVGAWQDRGRNALCHRLVITSVDVDGKVHGIYSNGVYAGWKISRPNYSKVQGSILKGKLVLDRFPSGNQAHYWFSGAALSGLYETSGGLISSITLRRQHE